VPDDERVQILLTEDEISWLVEGLDAREYWELGDLRPRNTGEVFIPGDLAPGQDRYWDGVPATADQREAIEAVRASRKLRDRLTLMLARGSASD
jgi:hypothetical protein